MTLTGPGGSGKTRLAVAAAKELQVRLECDTYFVDLHTATGLGGHVGGDRRGHGRSPRGAAAGTRDQALAFVASRPVLLVLDNLEQIPDADLVVVELLNAGRTCACWRPPAGRCTWSTSSSCRARR